MQKLAFKLLCMLPEFIYRRVIKIKKLERNTWLVKKIQETRFLIDLNKNFDEVVSTIAKNEKAMVINKINWGFSYFNVACIKNTLSIILYSLQNGYIPIIEINKDENDKASWDDFYIQPKQLYWENVKCNNVVECQITDGFEQLGHMDFYDSWLRNLWNIVFDKFLVFNEKTWDYIQDEINQLLHEKTLGVLCRGTDYTAMKPSGHPVQPDIEDVVREIHFAVRNYGYKKIYVATEEKNIIERLKCEFPNMILENKRTYYDVEYKTQGVKWIGSVHFERENDNFYKGLEYISSLEILAQCDGLIAGNCGGSQYAILRNASKYKFVKMFNLGLYE